MARPLRTWAAALALVLGASATLAQTQVPVGGLRADPNAPVEVEADALSVSQTDGTATFTGNVVILQGDLRLAAQKVRVDYAAAPDGAPDQGAGQGKITALHASGGVTMTSGQDDAAEADEAVYDVPAGKVTMTGNVLLTQGKNVVSGQALVVDLATGTGTMEGRVRTVLQPGGN